MPTVKRQCLQFFTGHTVSIDVSDRIFDLKQGALPINYEVTQSLTGGRAHFQ